MRIIQSQSPRPLNLLAVSSGGLIAAASSSAYARAEVEVWEATGDTRGWFHRTAGFNATALSFLHDGPSLVIADWSGVSFLKLRRDKGEVVEEARTEWAQASVVARGDRVYVGRSEASAAAVTCWGLPNHNLIWKTTRWEPHTYFCKGGTCDPVGKRVAFAANVGASIAQLVLVSLSAEDGSLLARHRLDPASPPRQLAFTADGAKLLVCTDSRTVHLLDAATGAPAGELVHPGRPYVTSIAVHPSGPVACARTNGTITLWDAEKREQLRTLDWKAGKLVSVAFSPDGSLGAAGTEDGKIIVWDVDL